MIPNPPHSQPYPRQQCLSSSLVLNRQPFDRNFGWPEHNQQFFTCKHFLQIAELSHTVINALSFRVEYRRGSGGTAMFQRQVRFQIDLSDVTNTHSPRDFLFAIIFTLHSGRFSKTSIIIIIMNNVNFTVRHSIIIICLFWNAALSCNPGNIRRFRRVCEHIQTQMCARKPPSSPRATRKFNTDLSESSSCGSDTSERLSPYVNIRNVSKN